MSTPGDHAASMRADAARRHAAMLADEHDGDAARLQRLIDGAGYVVRQPLLYLQAARAGFDDPCQFRNADNPVDRHVGDVRLAADGRHVVFAEGVKLDAVQFDGLVVAADLVKRPLQQRGRILPVTGKPLS